MNVLITAGGTWERIDAVRSIANTSTGALGSRIADCFAAYPEAKRIFYIHGPRAFLPQTSKAQVIPVTDTADLEQAVRRLLGETRVDAVAHCMAVSDFRVTKATTARRVVAAGLDEAQGFDRAAKISSGLSGDKLVLILEENPKIIGLFKELAPEAVLTGFKLLDGAGYDVLIDTAYALLVQNRCDFVLANDARDIHGDMHKGYLIDNKKNILPYATKGKIAAGIAEQSMQKIAGRGGE
jgi:phosphopantothenate-cysteine ligase